MLAKVTAHDNYPLDVKFAQGLAVVAAPGEAWEGNLTGDQLGYIAAWLAAKRYDPNIRALGGSVSCTERETSDKTPPTGSKKWLALVADGKVTPTKTEAGKYGLAAPPEKKQG